MKEYLSALLVTCIISATVRIITPDGAVKKYIKTLCSLCVVCVVITPIIGGISSLYDIESRFSELEYDTENYDEIYKSYLLDKNVELAEQALAKQLAEHLGVVPNGLSVTLCTEQDGETVSVTEVRVTLGAATVMADPEQIKSFIAEHVGTECEIIYGF